MALHAWTGERLDREELAIAMSTDAAMDPSASMGMVASACSGPHQYVIPLKRLGRFLVVHQELVLLCFDAPSLYLTVAQILRRIDGDAAAELFRGFFRTCRVYDVRLLDQLVRLARVGGHPVPRKLSELATLDPSSRAGEEAALALIDQGKSDVARDLPDPDLILGACQNAAAIFHAYRDLR